VNLYILNISFKNNRGISAYIVGYTLHVFFTLWYKIEALWFCAVLWTIELVEKKENRVENTCS
jgi:hypothetical protein